MDMNNDNGQLERYNFSSLEIDEMRHEMVDRYAEYCRLESEKKDVSHNLGEEMKKTRKRMDRLKDNIEQGWEMRKVDRQRDLGFGDEVDKRPLAMKR